MKELSRDAGRELDAIVAEQVFGQTVDESRCRVCGWPLRADVTLGCVPGNCALRPAPARRYDTPAPYSTEIAAAFLVVAMMGERNLPLTLRQYPYSRTYAVFGDWEGDWHEANGEHATPLAICLAALAALASLEAVSVKEGEG